MRGRRLEQLLCQKYLQFLEEQVNDLVSCPAVHREICARDATYDNMDLAFLAMPAPPSFPPQLGCALLLPTLNPVPRSLNKASLGTGTAHSEGDNEDDHSEDELRPPHPCHCAQRCCRLCPEMHVFLHQCQPLQMFSQLQGMADALSPPLLPLWCLLFSHPPPWGTRHIVLCCWLHCGDTITGSGAASSVMRG